MTFELGNDGYVSRREATRGGAIVMIGRSSDILKMDVTKPRQGKFLHRTAGTIPVDPMSVHEYLGEIAWGSEDASAVRYQPLSIPSLTVMPY